MKSHSEPFPSTTRSSRRSPRVGRAHPAELWRRLRSWRRIRPTRGGVSFSAGTAAVGLAAINTGNNLLFLLFGALCGFIALSGWLSERAIRGLHIERRIPRAGVAGEPFRLTYRVENRKKRWTSYAVELSETTMEGGGFLPALPAGESTELRVSFTAPTRGVYVLSGITVGTGFPFGLFRKERDIAEPAELVIWPRSDLKVRVPKWIGSSQAKGDLRGVRSTNARGEYRSLREFRSGDDPKDIHWKSTARRGEPVIRQYQDRGGPTVWISLDVQCAPGDAAEAAVDRAASMARLFENHGRRVGLVAGDRSVPPGDGPGHLDRIFDILARVEFSEKAPTGSVPVGEPVVSVQADRRPNAREVA